MKKLLLASAIIAAFNLLNNAQADENIFYVRADFGAATLLKTTDKDLGIKMSRTNHVLASLGLGSYLMDNVRAELNFKGHINPYMKGKLVDPDDIRDTEVKHSLDIRSAALRGIVDVTDFGYGKIFIGAGFGLALVKDKITDTHFDIAKKVIFKAKQKKGFTWSIGSGVGFDIADCVKLDIAYYFSDYGKTNSFVARLVHPISGTLTTYNVQPIHVRTHEMTAGIRFDL